MMPQKDENFYEFAYKMFYKFSHTKQDQVGLVFSRDIVYPTLEFNSHFQASIPLPKRIDKKYAFEGMLFENTNLGMTSMWSLFLATLYHLAAHAAVSSYSEYEEWKNNKTEDLCWQVIDLIEDIKVRKYISDNDGELWRNIERIELKLEESMQIKKPTGKYLIKNSEYYEKDKKRLGVIKDRILAGIENNDKCIIGLANFLYSNQLLLSEGSLLPCHEHRKPQWFLKFDKIGPSLEPFGEFEEETKRIWELWQKDEQIKDRLLSRYKKHLKNLNFDKIIVPTGDLHNFAQMRADKMSLIRRIHQQTIVFNLMDDSKICETGFLDMQMAIQAIAMEGATNEVFENDELRRGEEAWVILVDNSASMRLRFTQIKEFVVCLTESANVLTKKDDTWALYSFDNNFQILKDFRERYNQEVQARIGALKTGGLSLLPDAIELAAKLLAADPRDRKHLFVVTDGHPSGYERIQEAFSQAVTKTDVYGISLVAIGVSKGVTRIFKNSVRGSDLNRLVAKFISVYRTVSASSDM
jgi:hypothetical protein